MSRVRKRQASAEDQRDEDDDLDEEGEPAPEAGPGSPESAVADPHPPEQRVDPRASTSTSMMDRLLKPIQEAEGSTDEKKNSAKKELKRTARLRDELFR